MAKIVETPAYVVKELGLEFPPGQSLLWGLLIFGQQGIHFFVHASESALATMFRNATNGKPVIKWAKISGAVKYEVQRATSKNGKYSLMKTVTGTSLTNTSAKAGKTYYYKVKAYRTADIGNVYSYYSDIKSVKIK